MTETFCYIITQMATNAIRELASGEDSEFTDASANGIPVMVGDRYRLSGASRDSGPHGVAWIFEVIRAGQTTPLEANTVFFLTNDITNIDGDAALAALDMDTLYFSGLNSKITVLEHDGNYLRHDQLASGMAGDNYLGHRSPDVVTPRLQTVDEFQFTDKVYDRNGDEILGAQSAATGEGFKRTVIYNNTNTNAQSAGTNITLTKSIKDFDLILLYAQSTDTRDIGFSSADPVEIIPSTATGGVNAANEMGVFVDNAAGSRIFIRYTSNTAATIYFSFNFRLVKIIGYNFASAGGSGGGAVNGIADVPGLQAALDGKQKTLVSGDITGDLIKDFAVVDGKLASDSVNSSNIKDSAVTENKLAPAVRTKLNAETATPAPNTVNTAAIINAAVTDEKISTVNGSKIVVDSITENKLAPAVRTKLNEAVTPLADSVNTAAIQDNAVTGPKLADNAVTERAILASAVTSVKIRAESVTEGKLASNSVSNRRIATNAVSASKILDNAIQTAKIADNQVTETKLSPGVRTKLNAAGGGSVTPDDATISGSNATFTAAQLTKHANGLLVFKLLAVVMRLIYLIQSRLINLMSITGLLE